VTLKLPEDEADRLVCLFGDASCDTSAPVSTTIALPAYGYRWLRVGGFR
jgi:hypothetical protein